MSLSRILLQESLTMLIPDRYHTPYKPNLRRSQRTRWIARRSAWASFLWSSMHMEVFRNIRCRGLSCLLSDRLRRYSSVNWATLTVEAYWLQRLSVTLWVNNTYNVIFRSDIYWSSRLISWNSRIANPRNSGLSAPCHVKHRITCLLVSTEETHNLFMVDRL